MADSDNKNKTNSRTVREFLKELGCEQYAGLFEEEDITMESDLALMTGDNENEDLFWDKIKKVSDRKKIRKKIKEMQKAAKQQRRPKGEKVTVDSTSTEITVEVGNKLTVGPNAMCAVAVLENGTAPGDNRVANQCDETNIKLSAKEADIQGTVAVGHVKVCDSRHQKQSCSGSKEKESCSAPPQPKGGNSKIEVKFNKVNAGENSILAAQKVEIGGDPTDHSFFTNTSTETEMNVAIEGGVIAGIAGANFVKKLEPSRGDEENDKEEEEMRKKSHKEKTTKF